MLVELLSGWDDGDMMDEQLEQIVAVLKAMADPNRLRIIDIIMEGETCNCELTDRLGLTTNLLSHHLRVLKKAGLVSSRRDEIDKRWIYYRVNEEVIAVWHQWCSTFLSPDRIQNCKKLCGPEGQLIPIDPEHLALE